MNDPKSIVLNNLDIRVDEVPPRGLLATWRKMRRRVVISDGQFSLGFHYQELFKLCDGPILIEADRDSQPPGDYFLVSPEVIVADSAVGEALQGMAFAEGTLLLLEGERIIAELSPDDCQLLCSWLKEQA